MIDTPPVSFRTERGPPPYFAGRTRELAILDERVDILRGTRDPSEGMALIVGVPGVGKTQLGRKFTDELAKRDDQADIALLRIDTGMLASDVDVFMSMADALGRQEAFRRAAEIDTKVTRIGGGLGPVKGDMTQEHVRRTGVLSALLHRSKIASAWDGKVLVLVVDELQTISPAGMDNLRVLHEGSHGCPILPVGIGLVHTPQVLANPNGTAGISRVAQMIVLGALPEHEAREAVERGMAALGHAISECAVQSLAKASLGFPQHIHGYLAGAREAIAKHGHLDGCAALQDALKAGDQARAAYYDQRLGTLVDPGSVRPLVEAMVEQDRTSLGRREAVLTANKAGIDGENVVAEAIARGVLTPDSRGDVSFGIPSFHSYMIELRDG